MIEVVARLHSEGAAVGSSMGVHDVSGRRIDRAGDTDSLSQYGRVLTADRDRDSSSWRNAIQNEWM